jgi:dipeptidyl aminopeptidase/acylaminoacyl peptidase
MPGRPLIPRRTLYDNPAFFGAKLSPDGRFVSWLAPVDNVLNVWAAQTDRVSSGQPVTRTKGRPINWQDWSPDGRYIMFLNDENGDENLHLFAVDPQTSELRDVTPISNIRAIPTLWSFLAPDKVAVYLNDRDPRWHDVYLLDLATGDRSLIWENRQEFDHVGLDWQLRPRHARSNAADGGSRLWRIDGEKVTHWRDIPYDDVVTTRLMRFDAGGKHVHLLSSLDHNTSALVRVDWSNGDEQVLFRSERADVTDVIFNAKTFEAEAVCIDPGRREWNALTSRAKAELAFIRASLPDHDFTVQSQSDDDRRWIVMSYNAQQPATYHLLDRDRLTLTELFTARPELRSYRLAPMQTIEGKSRDGLRLVSYLTLPTDIEAVRPKKPLPMVLVVHGGPWFRDGFGYRGDHQWLADRGYAVLSVNYRGSTGFGKAFIAESEKQHARTMHDDLIDMVEWAVAEGIAQEDRIAIFGGSYGGYASFVGATFTPEVFCCAISVVGISNLQTLLESLPPYWAGFVEFMYRSYGDPRTEEGRTLLAERSPIHKVANIKRPMLIFHGANDVRCKVAESDSMVAAMQARNIPAIYVVYPDEGHGFAKPPNRLSYIAITEAFLAQHLGGAFEPIGNDLEGSSHQIRTGAEALVGRGIVSTGQGPN